MRVIELDLRGYAASEPVLDSLHAALRLVKAQKLSDFRRPAKQGDALDVGLKKLFGCVHRNPLNTMFTDDVNTPCINAVFSAPESRMHESMPRLLDCAKKATKAMRNPVTDFRSLGAYMGESAQTVNNWKSRGLSKDGALKAATMFGCNANWLLDGTGEMGKPKAAPADNLDHALDVLSRAVANSDRIAKLSLELLVAAIERDIAASGTNAQAALAIDDATAGNGSGSHNGRRSPTKDEWSAPIKTTPRGAATSNEQSVPVPHKKQSGA